MNIKLSRLILTGIAFVAAGSLPVLSSAHHSFASEYDRDQPFRIEGAVNSIKWTNPHGWIYIDVEEDGETVTYELELPSPSTLTRAGWRRNDLSEGDRVVVTGFRARTRYHVGRAAGISREDGEAVFGGGVSDADLSR